MPEPSVSIVVCTRDRAAHLRQTLDSLAGLEVPSGWFVELIVVDNGSSDSTREVVSKARFLGVQPRYVFEHLAGLCHARNRAIRESRGSTLLWTDDDVRVSAGWLRAMCEPILRGAADATIGTILIPHNLRERLQGTPMEGRLGLFASTEDVDFSNPAQLIGANMAFGRHVLDRIGEFDPALGAGPRSLGYGEETLFSLQLRDHGYRIVGVPSAIVEHHFDTARTSEESLYAMGRKLGASMAYIAYHRSGGMMRGFRLRKWKACAVHAVRLGLLRLRGADRRTIEDLKYRHASWLAYLESYRASSEQPPRHLPNRAHGTDRIRS